MSAARSDILISADVEADGPIPAEYSMLSFGLAVAGTWGRAGFRARDPRDETFYRELRPITGNWEHEALKITGFDRSRLRDQGSDPRRAMEEAAAWVAEAAGKSRPVLMAYPLGFDWMFLQWYFVRFTGGSPFGHGSALDIKTAYQQRANIPLGSAHRGRLPIELQSARRPVHHALEDAIDQADLFARLMDWNGRK